MRPLFLLLACVACAWCGALRTDCFPVERLPAELRPKAEALLLAMLDREALFTLAGGLKPMSSGFTQYQFPLRQPDLAKVEEDRRLLATVVRCGDELQATVHHFRTAYDGKRMLEGVVFHRPLLRQAVQAKQRFWAHWGIGPEAEPLEILLAVEYDETPVRLLGLGYLYGYPDHAVQFFADAAWQELKTREFVPRDFLHNATFARDTGYFTYAVPKGHAPNDTDLRLREQAARVLAEYRRRRAEYVGEGKKGVVELLRDWYCRSGSDCSSMHSLAEAVTPAKAAQ